MKRTILCLMLLVGLPVFAASSGTKIGNVPATQSTFVDGTVVNGTTYVYWVTAVDAESLPSNLTYATIPTTGTHTVSLSWTLSTSSGIQSQNIYRAVAPNPPTNLTSTVN